MLIPLLASYLLHDLLLTVTVVGVISAIRSFSQQGLAVLCGTLADRMGYKRTILIGLLIRTIGFGLFGFVDQIPGLIVAGFLSGLGASLFHPASYAYYASLSTPQNRITIYSIREMLSNLGFVIGPMVGAFLMQYHFQVVSFVATIIFAVTLLLSIFFLPQIKPERMANESNIGFVQQLNKVIKNRSFTRFMVCTMLAWSLFSQLYIAVPIKVNQVAEGANIGYIYSCGAIVMVLLQVPLSRLIHSRLKPYKVLALGTFLLATGLFTIGMSSTLLILYLGVVTLMIGQVFFQPMMNTMVSEFAGKGSIASYFGFNSFALSIGGIIGNVGGGYLYDAGKQIGWNGLPWFIFLLLSLINVFFMLKTSTSDRNVSSQADR